MIEYENLLEFERQKVTEVRIERNSLALRLEQLAREMKEQSLQVRKPLISDLKSESLAKQCLDAIKLSMHYNLKFIDFYKDLQHYVSSNFF